MQDDLISISDIAKELSLPESTVRYYYNRFTRFLPSIGDGSSGSNNQEAMGIFRTIAKSLRMRKTAVETQSILRKQYPRVFEVTESPMAAQKQQSVIQPIEVKGNALEQLPLAMEHIASSLDRISSELESQRNAYNKIMDLEIKMMKLEIERKKLNETLQMHEQEIMYMTSEWFKPKLPWWKRLFRGQDHGDLPPHGRDAAARCRHKKG